MMMWRRIGALFRKEFIQMKRDRRTLVMMILLPVIWLVAFGYAVNFDVTTIHVVTVDQAKSTDSKAVIKQISAHEKFVVKQEQSEKVARDQLSKGETDIVIYFPREYNPIAKSKQEQLRIFVDGSRLFTAQTSVREINKALLDIQSKNIESSKAKIENQLGEIKPSESLKLTDDTRLKMLPPVVLKGIEEQVTSQIEKMMNAKKEEIRQKISENLPNPEYMSPNVVVLFNPDLKSVNYMIPGLMGLVLIFITTLMTALGVVREKERGTLEQLIVSPLHSFELILGKLLPYMLIATLDFIVVFIVGTWLFQVPFTGDLFSYLLAALCFLFGSLGIGLLVSTVSQNQQQAMQLAVLTLFPQIILSGFIFPLEAMPWGIRWISYLMPLTYFLPISRDAFLKGMGAWEHPLPFALLAIFAVLFLMIATIRFRRSLSS
jgi:ABC-2 type transport system permease protein